VLEPSEAEVLPHQGVMGSDLCDPMPAQVSEADNQASDSEVLLGELESSPERVEISYEGESALAQCLPVRGQVSAVMQKGAELVISEKTNPTPPLRGKAVEGILEVVEPVGSSAELDAIQRET
jgi:hypothetical protein